MSNSKKILITGGTGTVATAFIKEYPNNQFYSISRSERSIAKLKRMHPEVECFVGNISDSTLVETIFNKVKPDVVIHAAAMKHVDLAENSPTECISANIVGTINIVRSCINSDVKTAIAISTDKACSPTNVYGMSKHLMEKIFLEHNTNKNRFSVCRFGNVAHSNGSVFPYWIEQAANNKKLLLTDKRMNRLIFLPSSAASLINKTIDMTEESGGGFVCSYKMKSMNMYEAAKIISKNIEIVGLRPGEKLNEKLISKKELNYSYLEGKYIILKQHENKDSNRLLEEYSSTTAEMMTKEEMQEIIFGN